MIRRILFLILILLWAVPAWAAGGGVERTLHNLSTSGPGSIKSGVVTQVCVFCHTPHNSSPRAPLWNRRD
ncbi:MAG: hypothetical protein OEY85_14630, partial [Rhodospirillales bacterium]|nr:hypothetical protein [Rhodospirillales bacterium]